MYEENLNNSTHFSFRFASLLLGICLVLFSIIWHFYDASLLSFTTGSQTALAAETEHTTPSPHPIHITIQKVHIDLPVAETVIKNNVWQIDTTGASHLTTSANPGTNGTIILYAHNTNDRFGPIMWLTKGDTIQLTTKNNQYTYAIQEVKIVSPNDTALLTAYHNETLIIYTCAGFADLQRYVVIAKPKK